MVADGLDIYLVIMPCALIYLGLKYRGRTFMLYLDTCYTWALLVLIVKNFLIQSLNASLSIKYI
jgi:hypothetical protein